MTIELLNLYSIFQFNDILDIWVLINNIFDINKFKIMNKLN